MSVVKLMGLIPDSQISKAITYLIQIGNFKRERDIYLAMLTDSDLKNTIRSAFAVWGVHEIDYVSRLTNNVHARLFLYKLLRHELNWPLERIGKLFGKTHCTVIHGLRTFENLFETDKEFKTNYILFLENLKHDKPSNDVSQSGIDTRPAPTDILIHRTVDN